VDYAQEEKIISLFLYSLSLPFIGFPLRQFSGKLALTVECGWLLVGGSTTSVDNPVYKGLV
jgi:hypothetical protein